MSAEDSVEDGVPPRRERIPLGILYMLGATITFTVSSAISKWQVETYSSGEVLLVRSFASLVLCALFILPRTGLSVFRTRRLRDHAARGLAQSASQLCIIIAFSLMPLAGAVAINFSAPLFATLASAFLFRETVGPVRWAALIVGFCGVLLVAGPGADSFQIGAAFAIANAILYGGVTAAVRDMTSTESTETLTMYQMIALTLFYTLTIPFGFIVPSAADGAVMVVNGFVNALGQYWWTRSLHLAPASAVAPFYYFSLVWAMMIGWAVWGDIPTAALLGGSAIVAGSGLVLLWWESRRRISIVRMTGGRAAE